MVFNQGVFDVLGRGDAHNQFNDGVCEFITLINFFFKPWQAGAMVMCPSEYMYQLKKTKSFFQTAIPKCQHRVAVGLHIPPR